MKNITLGTSLAALFLLCLLPACKGYDGTKAKEDRNAWLTSLSDSISLLTKERQQDSLRLEELHQRVGETIADFTTVSNPREVEEYYILKSFRSAYPLNSTGVAARVLKSEGLELVAALSGARFNTLRAVSGNESAETDRVPADQALNYTAGGLTTVAFSGAKADSVAMLISRNAASSVTLQYLNDGKIAKSISLTDLQKQWISQTWQLCSMQKEIHSLENSMLLSGRKLQILNLTLQRQSQE